MSGRKFVTIVAILTTFGAAVLGVVLYRSTFPDAVSKNQPVARLDFDSLEHGETGRGRLSDTAMSNLSLSSLEPIEAQANSFDTGIEALSSSLKSAGSALDTFSGEVLDTLDAGIASFRKSAIDLASIEFQGLYRLKKDEITPKLDVRPGDPLFSYSKESVCKDVLHHPWVEDAVCSIDYFPPTVSIRVEEKEPWLIVEYNGRSWLVSNDGAMLASTESLVRPELVMESLEYPRVDGIDVTGSSEQKNIRFNYALRQLRLFHSAGGFPYDIERYRVLDSGLEVLAADFVSYPKVLVDADSFEDASRQLGKLRMVLDDLDKKGEKISMLDLRFSGQAVARGIKNRQ